MSIVQSVQISAAVNGDNTVLAGSTGQRILVENYTLICAAQVTARWYDGPSTNNLPLSGPMTFAANGGVSPVAYRNSAVLVVPAGDNLVLNLSGAVQVSGHLAYRFDSSGSAG